MLVLARKVDERVVIGDQIQISVVEIRGDQVKLGIEAPKEVKIYRHEVYEAIQQENRAAAQAAPTSMPKLPELSPRRTDGDDEPID